MASPRFEVVRFEPPDIVAIIALIGCLVIVYAGKDGLISHVLMTIVGFYFGRKSK